ncbi:MAG: tRNA lysidine(34) synthetase TilS [Zoogloeaceae bacterium]|jgi:tRNA(Ile)-lysidine synthase|nr:tRNA lysidine(34) synthetase TilS [Zoogloeaceae bacterium]
MVASGNPPDPVLPLVARVAAFLDAALPDGVPLWVGFSGGRDSVVLLDLVISLLPGRVCALHVQHGLSPNADAWADFCAAFCRAREISFALEKVKVARDSGEGLEAAARRARYQAFLESGADWLALAHHQRDQVETLLFNLCRGAGVAGAAAMPEARRMGAMTLLRPLLKTSAADLAAYARARALSWMEDESNADERHARNFLRHRVLPGLAARFPAVETTLARAAGHFGEAQTLLRERADEDDRALAGNLPSLLSLSLPRQANWLRYRLHRQGWRVPDAVTLDEVLRQLVRAISQADSRFEFGFAEGRLHLWQGRLYATPHPAPPEMAARPWDTRTPCLWSGRSLRLEPCHGAGLDAALLAGKPLTLRPRQGGEKLQLHPRGPRRTLKNLLREAGIPPWERPCLPLLYHEETLIACPGIGIAANWQCPPDQPGFRIAWDQASGDQEAGDRRQETKTPSPPPSS